MIQEIQSMFPYIFIQPIFHYKGKEQYYVFTTILGILRFGAYKEI